MKPVIKVIDEILSFTSPDVEWLMRAGPIAERLNQESLGDCRSGTGAGQPPARAAARLGDPVTIAYRKEGAE